MKVDLPAPPPLRGSITYMLDYIQYKVMVTETKAWTYPAEGEKPMASWKVNYVRGKC